MFKIHGKTYKSHAHWSMTELGVMTKIWGNNHWRHKNLGEPPATYSLEEFKTWVALPANQAIFDSLYVDWKSIKGNYPAHKKLTTVLIDPKLGNTLDNIRLTTIREGYGLV